MTDNSSFPHILPPLVFPDLTFDFPEEDVSFDGGQSLAEVQFCFRVDDLLVLDESGLVQQDEPVLRAVAFLSLVVFRYNIFLGYYDKRGV